MSGPLRNLALGLAVVALLLAPKFANDFVIDDIAMIVEGTTIRDMASIPGFFSSHAMAANDAAAGTVSTYRPIALTTFVLDYQLWGARPFGYHLTNLLLHLIASCLVYVVAGILLGRDRWREALVATLLFAIHPTTAEAHVWINGRSDVLAQIFGLASMWSLDRGLLSRSGTERTGWSMATAGFFFVACLSKETALLFGPLLALHALLGGATAQGPRRAGGKRSAVPRSVARAHRGRGSGWGALPAPSGLDARWCGGG